MTYVPGWFVDPSLPTIPEDAPRCDRCDRRLTDIADGGDLPHFHGPAGTSVGPIKRAGDRRPNGVKGMCDRTRDDLLTLVYRMQRDTAGLGAPTRCVA